MTLQRQQGFTMIELIMVIVILGVLSAFALPRFADLGGSARTAAVEGVAGSIRSAIGITRAQVLASGVDTTAAASTVTLDGATIDLAYGYPAADVATDEVDASGIVLAAGLVDVGTADAASLTNGDFTITGTTASDRVEVTLQANCYVHYVGAANATTPPVVTVVTTGC